MKNKLRIGLLIFFLAGSMAWAARAPEFIAPGGGEVDLKQNLMKYYSDKDQPVEGFWQDFRLKTGYLEYYREQGLIKGSQHAVITEEKPNQRVLESSRFTYNQKLDFFTANDSVILHDDQETTLTGEQLEWDRKGDRVKLTGHPVVMYHDWTLTGTQVQGELKKELFTVLGPVEGDNKDTSIRGGKLLFDRRLNKLYLEDKPVVVKGNSETTATQIVYDLNTNKISAKGPVRTRIIEEKE